MPSSRHGWRNVATLALQLDADHWQLLADHKELKTEVADQRYTLDVDHITSSSLIHSVNKLERLQTPRGKKRSRTSYKTVVTDCRPRRSQRMDPDNTDRISEVTRIYSSIGYYVSENKEHTKCVQLKHIHC